MPGFEAHPALPAALRASAVDAFFVDGPPAPGDAPQEGPAWSTFVPALRDGTLEAEAAADAAAVAAAVAAASGKLPVPPPPRVQLRRGSFDGPLREALAPHADAAFVRLRGFGPGSFAGFADVAASREADGTFLREHYYGYWRVKVLGFRGF